MKKKVWLSAAVLTVLVLAGCGAEAQDSSVSENGNPAEISIVEVNMPDGSTVDCVLWDSYREGGIDCDWDRRR